MRIGIVWTATPRLAVGSPATPPRVIGPRTRSTAIPSPCSARSNSAATRAGRSSPGGTAINNPGSRIAIIFLNPTDTVYLASQPASAATVYAALRRQAGDAKESSGAVPPSEKPSGETQQLRVDRGVNVIGRDPDRGNKNPIVLAGAMVSRNRDRGAVFTGGVAPPRGRASYSLRRSSSRIRPPGPDPTTADRDPPDPAPTLPGRRGAGRFLPFPAESDQPNPPELPI